MPLADLELRVMMAPVRWGAPRDSRPGVPSVPAAVSRRSQCSRGPRLSAWITSPESRTRYYRPCSHRADRHCDRGASVSTKDTVLTTQIVLAGAVRSRLMGASWIHPIYRIPIAVSPTVILAKEGRSASSTSSGASVQFWAWMRYMYRNTRGFHERDREHHSGSVRRRIGRRERW